MIYKNVTTWWKREYIGDSVTNDMIYRKVHRSVREQWAQRRNFRSQRNGIFSLQNIAFL